MSHNHQKRTPIVPVGQQCVYFVLIGLACFMSLEVLEISFYNLAPYPALIGRQTLSLLVLLVLIYLIFMPYGDRYHQSHKLLIRAIIIVIGLRVGLYLFNLSVHLFRGDFDVTTDYFIGLQAFLSIALYVGIVMFGFVYFTSIMNTQNMIISSVFMPVLTIVLFIVLISCFRQMIGILNLELRSWPLWFLCFIFSFALLLSVHLTVLINYGVNRAPKFVIASIVVGIILSGLLLFYINKEAAFSRFIMMFYYNFPDFIR